MDRPAVTALSHCFKICVIICACNAFTHRVHRVSERHRRIKYLEYFWQYLYRIRTAGAGDLEHQYYDSCPEPDILKSENKRIVDHHERDPIHACLKHKEDRVMALYAYIQQVSQRNDQCLREPDKQIQSESSEESLMKSDIRQILSLPDFSFDQDGCQKRSQSVTG